MERRSILVQDLFEGIFSFKIQGSLNQEIRGIASDSRQIEPGFLFVAKAGGKRFVLDAMRNGATVIVSDQFYQGCDLVTQIVVPNLDEVEEKIGARFFILTGPLSLIGITGTNGKTTTAHLVRHLLEKKRGRCGIIGTIGYDLGDTLLPSTHTTPDLLENYQLFSLMKQKGCKQCVMEVSSHALDQGRVRGIPFDIAVFTNLTQDHLDYHKTMGEYKAAKQLLFTHLQEGKTAVINGDCKEGKEMMAKSRATPFTYGFEEGCDLQASLLTLSPEGSLFTVCYLSEKAVFRTPFVGLHNVYNVLAAIGVALTCGIFLDEIRAALSDPFVIPGRLEMVPNEKGVFLFIDYAHTEDALKRVLIAIRQFAKKRVITIFGCGGDRDRGKRPKMGKIAEELSDLVIVTTDNPRSEDPYKIIQEIIQGMSTSYEIIVDRKEAIERGIALAGKEDVVLIAGKGHEKGQIIGTNMIPFDDKEVALSALLSGGIR